MSQTDKPNAYCALVFALILLIFPPPRRDQQQGGQQPASQQDQNKQNQKNKKDQNKDPNNAKDNSKTTAPANTSTNSDKPAPLFGGSLNIKSSRQTKDTATLGFNGVDDNGQVQKAFLSAAPSGSDAAAVQKMASNTITDTDLSDFIQQGGLNSNAPQKKSSTPGGKP